MIRLLENKQKIILTSLCLFLGLSVLFWITLLPLPAGADVLGQKASFSIDKKYDSQGRKQTVATLTKITEKVYFYVDDAWWAGLPPEEQESFNKALQSLSEEFSSKIYPKLTSTFGTEAKPGIDGDERITILVHPMIKEAGGYFNTGDGYAKIQAPSSNEREMIYLNEKYINTPYSKIYLAHEFTHLINFNQKDKMRGISEEDWLNEARADYASTIVGYDGNYKNSNLEQRVNDFLASPSDSLTEWLNEKSDYGAANLFAQYLADQYGLEILSDSMKSDKTGISSINYALQKNGYSEDFSQVFSNWLVALLVNDCSQGPRYCYKGANLKNLKVAPKINYLPASSEVTLSVTYNTTYFSGNWQKIVGGRGNLILEFLGDSKADFSVPYVLCDSKSKCEVKNIALNPEKKGKIELADFSNQYSYFALMPFIKGKMEGFDGKEEVFPYSFKVTLFEKKPQEPEKKPEDEPGGGEEEKKTQLTSRINELKKEITRLQAVLQSRQSANKQAKLSCKSLDGNMVYGMTSDSQVRCLQEFLKRQGTEIYPEGLVTGNFFSATRSAVIRFQEKHKEDILKPAGLEKGTGYVGALTRKIINSLMGKGA